MSPRPFKPTAADFEACVELARNGRFPQAIEDLHRALGAQSLHAQHRGAAVEALSRIARLAEASGDLDQATRAMEEALRVAPQFPDVHCRLGVLSLARQRRGEARRRFEEALKLNPRYLAARVELALLDAREGLLGEALQTLRHLGDELSADQPRLFRQGIQSLEHADWDEAGSLLRKALHLKDTAASEVIDLFHVRMRSGDRAGAAQLIREALRQTPTYADLHYLLGLAELEEGRLDDAVSSLARALELHPDYHAARVQLARALEAQGDVVQAEDQVGLVLQADPRNPEALELAERWSRLRRRRRRPVSASREGS